MGLAYKIESKHFGFDKPGVNKFVATAVRSQTVDFDKVVEQISLRSGIAKVACRAVVETMTDAMCTWLTEGHGVSLGQLGYLKPSLTCKSSAVEGEEKITRKRVVFRPSTLLKAKIEAMSLDRITNDGSIVETDPDIPSDEDTSHQGGDESHEGTEHSGGDVPGELG